MPRATWPRTPLADLLVDNSVSYGIVQPGQHVDSGVPIVRVKDLGRGQIDRTSPLRVAPEISARHSRTVLRGGELLLSVVGTVGLAAVVSDDLAGWNVARAIAVLRPEGTTAEWLSLCFQTHDIRHRISGAVNTTVQTTLNLNDLKRILIPTPPPSIQRAITEVLGALDDKIAANAAISEKADALAAAVYQSVAIEDAPLSLLARFVNGKAFTKGASGTGRVVVRIAELNSGLGGSTVYNDIEVADDHVARPGDLLFAWSGSLTAARWFRPEAIINQHIFKVVADRGWPLWLVNQAVRSKLAEFQAIAADKATTMGHIQRRHLDQPVAIPSPEVVERIDGMMTGLWDTALAAELERERLGATRDELLPLLMSGRITVRDAEEVAEAAT